MNKLGVCVLFILLNLTVLVRCECGHEYSRHDFPSGFVFGSATTAYQVEGAASEDGRGSSIWDTFAHSEYANGASGDVAVDQYHKYKEDVKLMAEMGLDAYRFSISWSRLISNGRGAVNPKGVEYYNNLINELLTHGIKPHVTLNHADLPQALEDEYEGWINSRIVEDFTAYADVCFREFGDRVLYWITVNEPNIYAVGGYDQGITPPTRCSGNCSKGNSSSEPYIVVHNILLAHASVATLYKTKYQEKHKGFIGISVYTTGFIPDTNSREDAMAAQRMYDFYIGWVMNPLVFGDYPDIMKKLVGSRLPSFSNHESQLVRGSSDFFGVIHYTTCRVQDDPSSLVMEQRDFAKDMAAKIVGFEEFFTNSEYPIVPWGLQAVLEHIKQVYGNPPVYIVENGQKTKRNSTLEDRSRVEYLQAYIGSLVNAIRNGSNTRGYFAWSLLDVLEFLDGYKSGFGLYYVDLNDPYLNRQPKLSAYWYSQFLKGETRSICLNNNFSTLDH